MRKYPNSRLGWHDYYAKTFNQTESESSATLALWFYINYLAFGEKPFSEISK